MKTLILSMGVALLAVGPVARADEPRPSKPKASESEWKDFLDSLNPLAAVQRAREAEARRKAAENLRKIGEALHKYEAQGGAPKPMPPNWAWQLLPYIEQDNLYKSYLTPYAVSGDRLGADVEATPEAVAAQIDLPAGRGLLVKDVAKDSAAAKAGLKKFDILVKWDNADVAAAPAKFREAIAKAPAKKTFTAVVLRKGKEVTLKDITLPEAGPATNIKTFICPSDITDGSSNTLIIGGRTNAYSPNINLGDGSVRWLSGIPALLGGVPAFRPLTTTFRQDDRFTTRYEEGSLVITLTGTLKNNKAAVSQVKVIDGSKEYRFESIDKTPEEYRDKARGLVKSTEANKNPLGGDW